MSDAQDISSNRQSIFGSHVANMESHVPQYLGAGNSQVSGVFPDGLNSKSFLSSQQANRMLGTEVNVSKDNKD